MEALEAIKTRRSIRKYKSTPVDDKTLELVLEAGRWAPSGLNNQPWRFRVVRDPLLKEGMARLTESSYTIYSADILICVFLDRSAVYNRTKDLQAVGACIQNMLLEAHSLGIGACWLGEILNQKKRVARLLKTPSSYELMTIISLGWPVKKKGRGKRKKLERLIYKGYM